MARQLLTESLVLALIGGAVGVDAGVWGTNLILAASPANLLDLQRVPIDWRVLAFACRDHFACRVAVWILAVVPFGARGHCGNIEGGKDAARLRERQRRTVRSTFVVAQIGLALVLLAGSGC